MRCMFRFCVSCWELIVSRIVRFRLSNFAALPLASIIFFGRNGTFLPKSAKPRFQTWWCSMAKSPTTSALSHVGRFSDVVGRLTDAIEVLRDPSYAFRIVRNLVVAHETVYGRVRIRQQCRLTPFPKRVFGPDQV